MKYKIIPVTPFQQNCSLIWDPETKKAALVDPGGEADRLMDEIEKHGVTLDKILLTHGHLDHVGAANDIKARTGVEIYGPEKSETFWLQQLKTQCEMFGFPPTDNVEPDHWFEDGDQVQIGKITLDVLHTPGHTPGHIVFINQEDRLAFVGDVLFDGSIGRTDFPMSKHEDLINAIRTKLWPLGDDIQFVPGHGPMSTFGRERQSNPFVGDHVS